MSRVLRWSWAAVLAIAGLGVAVSCSGGGGGDGGDGDGEDVVGFGFNPSNIEFAAGLGARVIDTFPPLTDLLSPALVALGEGSVRNGEARALPACGAGAASLLWTDGSGDGTWSAGDTARIDLSGCRVHADDGVVLGGSLTLTFSSVVRESPRSVAAKLELVVDADDGQAGTLRGLIALTAAAVDEGRYGLVFQPSAGSLLTATGSTPYQLGCFEVRDDPTPELGFGRRVVALGVIRTGDKIISFDPGGKFLYRSNDVPGAGRVGLLSIAQPLCTEIGVDPGGVRSDNAMVNMIAAGDGEVSLDLYRVGSAQPAYSHVSQWNELLHQTAGGVINGTNVVDVAGAALFALDLPRQVGAVGLDLVIGEAAGKAVSLCSSGGYGVSGSGPLTVGTARTLTFDGCVTGGLGDALTLDGSVTFTVTAMSGDATTSTYSLATEVSAIDIDVIDIDTSRITGAFRFERTASTGAVAELAESEAGATLTLTEGTNETSLGPFSLRSARSDSGAFTTASIGDTMTVSASGISGALAVSVDEPVSGAEREPPSTGSLEITAVDATSVVVHLAGVTIDLGLDSDGDGTVDVTIPTTWDELD